MLSKSLQGKKLMPRTPNNVPKLWKITKKPKTQKILWEEFDKLKKTFGPKKLNAPLKPNCKVSLCQECKFLKMLKKVYKRPIWTLKKKKEMEITLQDAWSLLPHVVCF